MIHVKANVISKINADASIGGAVKVGGLLNQKIDYNTQVANKPSINNVMLKGNKTLHDLGIQPEGDYATISDIPTKVSELQNDSGFITSSALPTKTSDLQNDSGFIDADDLPKLVDDGTYYSFGNFGRYTNSLGIDIIHSYYGENKDLIIPTYEGVMTASAMIGQQIQEVAGMIPYQTSQLQNDSGYITSADLPKAISIIAVPFDANDVMLGTPTAYYQFTKREYIDTSTMTVSHWYSADEMADMGNPYLYCNVLKFQVFPLVTDIMHHSHYQTLDGMYLTYDATSLQGETSVRQYFMGDAGRCIKAELVEDGIIANVVKGYLDNILLDADFVQDANYVHIDGENNNAKRSNAILMGKVDATSTSTKFTATVGGFTELYDGLAVYLTNGVVTSASGFTLNINGTGDLPVYQTLAAATRSTTIFNVNYTMLFIYNSQRVTGGCWDIFYGYNSDTNTIAYQVRVNGSGFKAQAKFYRYRLLFETMDGEHVVPANTSTSTNATTSRTPNTAPFNPWGRIFYYATTTAVEAEAIPNTSYMYERYGGISLGYSFAKGSALTMTYPKAVYLKCTPQSDNSVVLDATDPYVQALPSTEDGSVYIYLGQATSATAIELAEHHPVYQYKNGKVCLFTGN